MADAHEIAKGIRRLHLLNVALAAKAGDEGDLREACDQAEEAIAAAIMAEREACAKVAEARFDDPGWNGHYQNAGVQIATAIRSRTPPGKTP